MQEASAAFQTFVEPDLPLTTEGKTEPMLLLLSNGQRRPEALHPSSNRRLDPTATPVICGVRPYNAAVGCGHHHEARDEYDAVPVPASAKGRHSWANELVVF